MKDNWRNAIRAIVNEVIAAKASEREALPAFLEERGGGFLLITPSLSPRASKQKRDGARPEPWSVVVWVERKNVLEKILQEGIRALTKRRSFKELTDLAN